MQTSTDSSYSTSISKKSDQVNSSGSIESAQKNLKKMMHGSPAYQKFIGAKLKELGKNHYKEMTWDEVPIITKKEFYNAYPWEEIIPKKYLRDIYTVYRSSGTTAANGTSKGFFWPQLKSDAVRMEPTSEYILNDIIHLNKHSTLAIIGLSLGSWAGGEQFSFLLKRTAMHSKYPLVVFSPGNQHYEILELIDKCHNKFSQIIVALCPSAIFYLERLAEKMKIHLPLEKISFLTTGEPFPESMRMDLQKRTSRSPENPVMLSLYGSADTGMLGLESRYLIKLRQLLSNNPTMAQELGFTPYAIPNLYHVNSTEIYMEVVNDELVVTRWQGLPLIRYNLQDKVKLFSWEMLCSTAAMYDKANESLWQHLKNAKLTDVVAVWGRSKGCLFLCGSNIFETMLQEVLLRSSIAPLITGAFVVWTEVHLGQQTLHWQIELKPGIDAPKTDVHSEFVSLLSIQQPEFADDYEKFYRPFESDGLRIFHFHFCASPALSENPRYNSTIKKKIIIERGPI